MHSFGFKYFALVPKDSNELHILIVLEESMIKLWQNMTENLAPEL